MLIDVGRLKIVSLADLDMDLEKAGFKHGYYTHLVPKKIRGKDGVERIYWVSPDAGKKQKLSRVLHFNDGEERDHHTEIATSHEIDKDAMLRFSAGDKVATTHGKDKGREGIFRASMKGDAPRVSVAFLNPKTGKYSAETHNVNHIKLVHRANDDTSKVVERKTVETTNLLGETTLVDRDDYDRYYGPRSAPGYETQQEKIDKIATTPVTGGVYERPDGRRLAIGPAVTMGGVTRYDVTLTTPGAKPKTGSIEESKLTEQLKASGYRRLPAKAIHAPKKYVVPTAVEETAPDGTKTTKTVWAPPKLGKDGEPVDDTGGKWVKDDGGKPLSAALERGELHAKGHFAFNPAGRRILTPEDQVLAVQILAEHWTNLERVAAVAAGRYPSVAHEEVTASDISEALISAVASYEPLLDVNGWGISHRLQKQAKGSAKRLAMQIHEREMSMVRDDWADDSVDSKPATPMDKAALEEWGDTNDIIASAFISKHDAMVLDEGLRDEADLMSWLYGDEKILDIMKKWTGVGVFEASLNKKEAAEALVGYVYNPATMKPYALSTIETVLLPKELERITAAFKAEGKIDPTFLHTLKQDITLRANLTRKRKYGEIHPKDVSVVRAKAEEVKKPSDRANFAADLIRRGVPMADVPLVIQVADRILSGMARPGGGGKEYLSMIPMRLWDTAPAALTGWFRDTFGKPGKLPVHLDFEAPFKEAMASSAYKDFLARKAA